MTSKWKEEFCSMYTRDDIVKSLNKEIKIEKEKQETQRQVDQNISNILRDQKLKKMLLK